MMNEEPRVRSGEGVDSAMETFLVLEKEYEYLITSNAQNYMENTFH